MKQFLAVPVLLFAACDQSPVRLGRSEAADTPWYDPAPNPGRFFVTHSANILWHGVRISDENGIAIDPLGPYVTDHTQSYYQDISPPDVTFQQMTFNDWKNYFQFPVRGEGETVQAFRDRGTSVGPVAVFFNRNELGLGRELACSIRFVPGDFGYACYVVNYLGAGGFGDFYGSIVKAIDGTNPANGVGISYRANAPDNRRMQFMAWDAAGNQVNTAQIDALGQRLIPEVCVECHGGEYYSGPGTYQSHFIPANVWNILYADSPGGPGTSVPGLTGAGQQERLRAQNYWPAQGGVSQPNIPDMLTDRQRFYVFDLYDNNPWTPGQQPVPSRAPLAWSFSATERDIYTKALLPYCTVSCHNAITASDSSLAFVSRSGLQAWQGAVTQDITSGRMPHSYPTLSAFWSDNVTDEGGVPYPNAKRLLFDKMGWAQPQEPPQCDQCVPTDCGSCPHGTYCDGTKGGPGCGTCFCSQ